MICSITGATFHCQVCVIVTCTPPADTIFPSEQTHRHKALRYILRRTERTLSCGALRVTHPLSRQNLRTMSLRAWSRVSVFVFLLVATSCQEEAAEQESDGQPDSAQDTDGQGSQDTSGDAQLRKDCCLRGEGATSGWGSCVGKARRYIKTLSLDEDKGNVCRVAFSVCCGKATPSSPDKDVKQLGGGSRASGRHRGHEPLSEAKREYYRIREECCEAGHQSLRQPGRCWPKARAHVRTLTLSKSNARMCRMLFSGCCYRASRVAKPLAPQTPGEGVRQLGGATSREGDTDQKAEEPVWKRRLTTRCCNAGKRSAAATSGSCQTRARTMARKTRARGKARRVQEEDMEACSQTFIRCCNEVPIGQ
ncbi:Hypp9005 [Branchiostoma lanceolatum]|uniref:Hypp9005 protein n=1 Tax=Branchiostoma lanceolatum TaxID=7740 RepID=A0A8K0EHF9_BRALA|nr:Hypp9005 [Branchiostoma lanceolatum]